MTPLLTVPQAVAAHARIDPDRAAAKDSRRTLSFAQWDERANRLANALLGMGLRKGDRVAILAYNCIEWAEMYVGLGKAGLIAVPVNFRLLGPEIRYIARDAGARAFIVQDELRGSVASIRAELDIPDANYVHIGRQPAPAGYVAYEALLSRAAAGAPGVTVAPQDTWALMYTSGTTGNPKGAIRSHASQALMALVTALDFGFSRGDAGLLVMPMCHANSLNFFSSFAYCGATCGVYDRHSFDPEHLLATLSAQHVSFTSLVPTHYIMTLGLSQAVKSRYDVASVNKLLISSAPARRETKLAIMEHFRNSRLYELYGSTEAGWVTLLRPDEQLTKLGSVGREFTGTGRVRLLDEAGNDVPDGEVGELYSRTPYSFDGYWNLPDKTAEAFRGDYCTVGDMARRDAEGFYHLVDRKKNMIISGGENVYPSEVENLLARHPAVKDVAVIGVPHEKWGEAVHAVVVLNATGAVSEADLLEWCRDKLAGYKRPRSISFMRDEDVPRTATGKIQHRLLRERIVGSLNTTGR
ncbi:MAG TPA: AMP-binding protein [Burkholderiales bacterium]|nr:AMP-binding protein [Burkholderiales bacterium]